MKILLDRHHQALYSSLLRLFEDRLGYEAYCPIGMEWWDQGYWRLNDLEATALQYLAINQIPSDGTNPLNTLIDKESGIFILKDPETGKPMKSITLDAFKKMQFDILIASVPQHIEPFKKLIALYQPQAKLIYQIGNQWNVDPREVKNVLASAKVDIPSGVNGVIYHQEFDLGVFRCCGKCYINEYHTAWREHRGKRIYSFINCLGTAELFKKDWELFLELERLLPEIEFKSFGGQCRDGYFGGDREVAEAMMKAGFIYQVKSGGDGYGHNIFGAAAMGVPLITRYSDYKGKLAESLLRGNGPTSIFVDSKTPQQIADEIRAIFDFKGGEGYSPMDMGKNIYDCFKQNVNFDKEQKEIESFLSKLI